MCVLIPKTKFKVTVKNKQSFTQRFFSFFLLLLFFRAIFHATKSKIFGILNECFFFRFSEKKGKKITFSLLCTTDFLAAVA